MGQDFDMESQTEGFDGFSDKAIRRGFIKKVYTIISVQLLLTFGTVAAFQKSNAIREWFGFETFSERGGRIRPQGITVAFWAIFAVSFISSISIIIAMACVRTLRVAFPLNFVMLGLFTLAESVLVGQSCMFYSHDLVLVAAGLTALLVVGLTIFAFQTKIDFTACGGILFCVLFIFVICGILMGVIASTGAVNIPLLHVVYSGIGLIIFSVYLVYDTQMMMGGSHKYSISPEEYIFAAIAIYLDIINIFLYILRILGAANKS